ncbi:serine/threonine protein kinase [Myxococcaceae bacterium JPH2]|nr:serine/threonine protein kinase [Myxococcaceae bacterium JPH2]
MTTRFGRFELLERLGVELPGVLYRALDTEAPEGTRPIALLRIFSEWSTDGAWLETYRQGAQLAMRLQHDHIVRVFEFGSVDGEHFLVSEALDALNLLRVQGIAKRHGHRELPPTIAASILVDVCRALHFAHTLRGAQGESLGFTHDNLSPATVYLTPSGEVKVDGFGTDRVPPPHAFGVLRGKRVFFSPEQIRGQALDARSDVYVAGLVLYRLLCNRSPFPEDHEAAMFASALNDQLIPATTHVPTLDAPLAKILHRALRADPAARYASAEALAQALSAWLQSQKPSLSAADLQQARRELLASGPKQQQHVAVEPPPHAVSRIRKALARLLPRS